MALAVNRVVRVCIKDKQIDVRCGDGDQTIDWVVSAALCRCDNHFGVSLGPAQLVRKASGELLALDGVIRDLLPAEGAQVFVTLKHT